MIAVAIVEDDANLRSALEVLLNGTPNFRCVATFGNAEHASAQLPEIHPDIVLMDIHLPGETGIECIRKVRDLCPNTQFMMFTSFENDENIFEAIAAGASGYLLKNATPLKLLAAIEELYQGGSPMSMQISRKVLDYLRPKPHPNQAALATLTPRETEILQQLAKGFLYKEIAAHLEISIETVRRHLHNVYEKLHVQTRTEAVTKFLGQ